jgi:hypothetical protein
MTQAQSIESLPKLPQRPSALIKLACDDAEVVYRNPKYRLDLGEWHSTLEDSLGRCAVCFAGAVMAGTLGADPSEELVPSDFGADERALAALNHFRLGGSYGVRNGVQGLLRRMLTDEEGQTLLDSGAADIEIPHPKPGTKGVAFLRAMRKVAAKLEAVGW